jgi:hypothetical protein
MCFNMADVRGGKLTISPKISTEDQEYLGMAITKLYDTHPRELYYEDMNSSLQKIYKSHLAKLQTAADSEQTDSERTYSKKINSRIQGLWGWILTDWNTIEFGTDIGFEEDLRVEQITEIIHLLKKRGYKVNGSAYLFFDSHDDYAKSNYLKIINNKIYEFKMVISEQNIGEIIDLLIIDVNNLITAEGIEFRVVKREKNNEYHQKLKK